MNTLAIFFFKNFFFTPRALISRTRFFSSFFENWMPAERALKPIGQNTPLYVFARLEKALCDGDQKDTLRVVRDTSRRELACLREQSGADDLRYEDTAQDWLVDCRGIVVRERPVWLAARSDHG